jgi:hypothetical protein
VNVSPAEFMRRNRFPRFTLVLQAIHSMLYVFRCLRALVPRVVVDTTGARSRRRSGSSSAAAPLSSTSTTRSSRPTCCRTSRWVAHVSITLKRSPGQGSGRVSRYGTTGSRAGCTR